MTDATTLKLTINGAARELAGPLTVMALLEQLGIDQRHVAVERNKAIVRKPDFARTGLASGDRLEIVTFVGGG